MFEDLIMLFGAPRSGTTWIGKIFDSHPQTIYFHEPDSVILARDISHLPDLDEAEQYRDKLHNYVNELLILNGVKMRGKLPIFEKRYFSPWGYTLHRLSVLTAKGVSKWANGFPIITPVASAYAGKARRVWKSIESSGRLAMFAKRFPEAKGVYILRHPCGYVASTLRGKRLNKFESAYDPGRDPKYMAPLLKANLAETSGLSMESFNAMDPVARLAWRWVLTAEKILNDLSTLDNCRILRYEDMCLDPISETRRLFAFVGLDWAEQTAAFLESSSATDDKRYYSVFRDSKEAAESWRTELPQSDIDEVFSVVRGSRAGALFNVC